MEISVPTKENVTEAPLLAVEVDVVLVVHADWSSYCRMLSVLSTIQLKGTKEGGGEAVVRGFGVTADNEGVEAEADVSVSAATVGRVSVASAAMATSNVRRCRMVQVYYLWLLKRSVMSRVTLEVVKHARTNGHGVNIREPNDNGEVQEFNAVRAPVPSPLASQYLLSTPRVRSSVSERYAWNQCQV